MSPPREKNEAAAYEPALFEPVHVVSDGYDGVLQGLADLKGAPHRFRRRFDTPGDAYSDVFELVLLDERTFALERERWDIWMRWKTALQRGEVGLETHPSRPEERSRHAHLVASLRVLHHASASTVAFARGEFRSRSLGGGPGGLLEIEVRWSNLTH